MQKTLYVSTPEGQYFFSVLNRVDGIFRRLYKSLTKGKIDGESYKGLVLAWEKFLDQHTEFLTELSQRYATEYTEKTRQKKLEISLKELRESGQKHQVSLKSFLGEKLFRATVSTEMCFKLVHEFALTGDVTIDAMLDLAEAFSERRKVIENYVVELSNLEKKVVQAPPRSAITATSDPQNKHSRRT